MKIDKTNEQFLFEIEKLKSNHNQPIDNVLESEQNFKMLVESARDGIIVIQNDIIKFANPHANEIYGASLNKIIGQSFIKFVHPDSLEMVKKHYTDWKSGKKVPNYFQVDLIDSTKEKRICEISSSTIVFNGLPSELVIIHDITMRKQAEEALRKSENKFSSIVESSPMGMHLYSLNQDGKLIFRGSNPAADVILGVDNSQFVGKTIEEAFPPLAETEVPQKYRLVADKGESWQTEQIVYEDEKINGASEVYAFQISPGNMVALFMDITNRKQAEEALRQYKHIVSSSTDMLALLDRRYKYLAANETYFEAFKFTPEQIIGKTVVEIFGEKVFDTVIRPNAERCLKGEKVNYQDWFDFPTHGRYYMDINYYPYYSKDNEIIGFVVNGRNITERKIVEEVLKESEAKYKEIATSMPGVVYQFKIRSNGSYEFPYMDESSERFFQQKSKDLEADPNLFFNMVPPEEIKSFISSIEKTQQTMKEWRHNFRLVLPDGQTRWFEGRSIPHLLPSGEPLWNGVVIDVTERKRVEEKLINRNKELELFNEVTVGRELKMIKLKKEINELLEKSGEKPKYEIPV